MRRRNNSRKKSSLNDSWEPISFSLRKRQQKTTYDCTFLVGLMILLCLLLSSCVLHFLQCQQIDPELPSKRHTNIPPRAVILRNDGLDVYPMKRKKSPETHSNDDCQPFVPWEGVMNVNCNTLHEIDLVPDSTKFVNHGCIREVWSVIDGFSSKVALKTRIYSKSFSSSNMDGQLKDAKISDQLAASDYVAKIYGYCAFSALYDFASGGSLDDNYKSMTKLERLQTAVEISKGLADVHDLGLKGMSAVIHNDIAIRQFINVDGRYKINDFNTARILKWNPKTKTICKDEDHMFPDKNRSPEELRNKINYIDEKIDVYSLGNIFFKLIANKRKYNKMSTEESMVYILQGHIPEVEVKDHVDAILQNAMIMCLQLDPADRSSARDIYLYLQQELDKILKMQ